jgi:hypothetical protein
MQHVPPEVLFKPKCNPLVTLMLSSYNFVSMHSILDKHPWWIIIWSYDINIDQINKG